jgi:hypothetical protein
MILKINKEMVWRNIRLKQPDEHIHTIYATHDSWLGTDLQCNASVYFVVDNLKK